LLRLWLCRRYYRLCWGFLCWLHTSRYEWCPTTFAEPCVWQGVFDVLKRRLKKMHLRIQEAKLGLTIPILHDTFKPSLLMYYGTLGRGPSVKGNPKKK